MNLSRLLPTLCAALATAFIPLPASSQTLDAEQQAFLTLINNFRAQNGVGPLQVSVALQNAAQWMSADMAAKSYFSHTDSLGRDPFQRMAAFGYGYSPAGENIAAGNATAQNTFNQWQASPGHRANMLNASFRVIGIGRAYNAASPYRWYWTTPFGGYVDQVLGSPAPPGIPPPVVGFFSASPSVVMPGQTTILSWSVSGAASLSIDNGVGDVTGVSSRTVAPSGTTTYRLTARNAAGTASAQTTVTVYAPAADTQPPAAPSVVWASPASANAVNLSWSSSTDNVGVTGYQIFRNNVVLSSVPGTSTVFVDSTAQGGTTYTYGVRAYDAAGNYSALRTGTAVTTPPSVIPSTPASITPAGGSAQVASVGTQFAAPLQARVLNSSSQPVAGVTVNFTAPASGASATFVGASNIATAVTDAAGVARSPALVANGTAGTYSVAAAVSGVAPAAFTLTNASASTPPPPSGALSLFGNTTPALRVMMYGGPAEAGVRFRSNIAGRIVGVRFYKNSQDGGVHTGSLWTADGRLLATGTFTNETPSGWQTLRFSSPVAIAANTTYVASYHTNTGALTVGLSYFASQSVTSGPLVSPQDSLVAPNGLFLASEGGKFPSGSSMSNNYWVDVLFEQ